MRLKTGEVMRYGEIAAVCSQIYTKHVNTRCGQKIGLVNVNHGGTYSNHWAVNYLVCTRRMKQPAAMLMSATFGCTCTCTWSRSTALRFVNKHAERISAVFVT
jgi:hypothetical protein